MCPRVPFADMVKHFAPISTVESPDAGKHTSKNLSSFLHHQLNYQQSSHSSLKGSGMCGSWQGLLDTGMEKVLLCLMGESLFDPDVEELSP